MFEIENTDSGHVLGTYEGDTKDAALDALARDAGYPRFESVPHMDRSSLNLTPAEEEEGGKIENGLAPESGPIVRAFRRVTAASLFSPEETALRNASVAGVRDLPLDEATFSALGEWVDSRKNDTDPPTARSYHAYEAFKRETVNQFDRLRKAGVEIYIADGEPYDSAAEVTRDLRSEQRLAIRGTRQQSDLRPDHPMNEWARYRDGIVLYDRHGTPFTYNDCFRAVHDAFTHCHLGADAAPFNVLGEYRANCAHILAYSLKAAPAFLCEAAGLVAWMYWNGTVDPPEFPDRQPARAVPGWIVDRFFEAAIDKSARDPA